MSKKKINRNGIVYSTNPELMNQSDEAEERTYLPVEKQNILLRIDKKQRSGKIVTLISGFDASPGRIEEIVRDIKKFCGTGGTLGGDEILIQGDARERIKQWLSKNGYKNFRSI